MNFKIDNLQYCKWDRSVFEINREAGLDAVHVTIVYHEDFDELQQRILEWKTHFKNNDDLIFLGKDGAINAALYAASILGITDKKIKNSLLKLRIKQTKSVKKKPK